MIAHVKFKYSLTLFMRADGLGLWRQTISIMACQYLEVNDLVFAIGSLNEGQNATLAKAAHNGNSSCLNIWQLYNKFHEKST